MTITDLRPLGQAQLSDTSRPNRVYSAIKKAILTLEIKPGSIIQEEVLAQQLGVSRTPVREAVHRLEQERLVKTLYKKGILVADLTADDVLEIFQVRMAVEPLAARLAANLMPLDETLRLRDLHLAAANLEEGTSGNYRELHRSIALHCGNGRLMSIIESLMDETTRVLARSRPADLERQGRLHLEIIGALERRDGLAAELFMEEHLLDFRRSFISSLTQ